MLGMSAPLLATTSQIAHAQSAPGQVLGMTILGPTIALPNGMVVLSTPNGAYRVELMTSYGPVVFDAANGCYAVVTAYGVAGPVVMTGNGPAVATQNGPVFLGSYRPSYSPPSYGGQPSAPPQFQRPPAVAPTQAPPPPAQPAPAQSGGGGGGGINIGNIIEKGIQLLPKLLSLFG